MSIAKFILATALVAAASFAGAAPQHGDELKFDFYPSVFEPDAADKNGKAKGDPIFLSSSFETPYIAILENKIAKFGNKDIELEGQSFAITIPEPGTLALLGLGLFGLGAARRRQQA